MKLLSYLRRPFRLLGRLCAFPGELLQRLDAILGRMDAFWGKFDPFWGKLDIISARLELLARSDLEVFEQRLLQSPRYHDPTHLAHFEHQIYSQNGEDGIIIEIFRRVGHGTKTFIEVGVGDGLENNTAFLLSQGWKGLWIDGSPECGTVIRREFSRSISAGDLLFVESLVTAENVATLVHSAGFSGEIDLLSVDIDQNTYYILKALLGAVRPRVVVVEYNATMPPWLDWKVRYESHRWYQGSFYFGASLKAFELLGKSKGYSLVGCELHGVNAFLVRDDLVAEKFSPPFTAEATYEPPRYWLIRTAGHQRGFGDFGKI